MEYSTLIYYFSYYHPLISFINISLNSRRADRHILLYIKVRFSEGGKTKKNVAIFCYRGLIESPNRLPLYIYRNKRTTVSYMQAET